MPWMLLCIVCRADAGKLRFNNLPLVGLRRALLCMSVVAVCLLLPPHAFAAKPPADVRLLIDVSGSMKQNDPKNLRRPALELLVQVVPEKSRAGVWTFGQAVNMLVPHQAVTEKWRKDAAKQVNQIGSVALYTDIGQALEKAAYDFNKLDPKLRTSVILLTDGMVDVSQDPQKDAASRERILKEIMPRYRAAGVAIHSVALSKHADTELLEQLAIGTNGITAVAENADELMKVFLRLFDEAAPPDQVPLKDNKFLIDSSVKEFTALVFRKKGAAPTYLTGPDAKRIDEKSAGGDVRWHATADYDLVTVSNPFEGEWKLSADADPDTRVTVVSDLSLDVERLPKNLFVGNLPTLHAQLTQDGKILKDKAFLSIIDVSVEVHQTESDKRWRKSLSKAAPAPEDGIYSASLSMIKEVAPYEVSILVDGKTFQRSAKQLVTVREAFELTIAEDKKAEEQTFLMTVTSRMADLDPAKTKVDVRVIMPDKKTLAKSLEQKGDNTWQLPFTDADVDGTYRVAATVQGIDKEGKEFRVDPTIVEFTRGSPTVVAPTEPKPEAAPKAEKPAEESKPEAAKAPGHDEKPAAEKKPEAEKKEDEHDKEGGLPGWLLWTGLALGNLLVAGLGFAAYRMVRGRKQAGVLDDESSDNADISLDAEPAGGKDKTRELLAELAGSDGAIQLDESKSSAGANTDIIDIGGGNDDDDPFAELLGNPDDK